jgi:hypothetical protein
MQGLFTERAALFFRRHAGTVHYQRKLKGDYCIYKGLII